MKQFLIVALLGLSFVVGFAAIGFTVWPQISTPAHRTAFLKEIP